MAQPVYPKLRAQNNSMSGLGLITMNNIYVQTHKSYSCRAYIYTSKYNIYRGQGCKYAFFKRLSIYVSYERLP